MQCRETSDLMMKYFDNEISEFEKGMLMKHNEKCPECILEFQALESALLEVEALPEFEAPVDLEMKVMERIKASEAESNATLLNAHMLLFVLASVAGLMILSWNIMYSTVIPMLQGGNIFTLAYDYLMIGFNQGIVLIKDAAITFSLALSRLIAIRNLLITDYLNIIGLVVVLLMAVNLLLVKVLIPQEN